MLHAPLRSLVPFVLLCLLALRAGCGQDVPAAAPTAASGPATPAGPATTSAAPPAGPAADAPPGKNRLKLRAQRQIWAPEAGRYTFTGAVTLDYDTVHIEADEIVYDETTRQARAAGHVGIRTDEGPTYAGDALVLDTRTRQWQFTKWAVEYPPGQLGDKIIAPVYASGQALAGEPSRVAGDKSRLTSCDLPGPHYYLQAERVEIIPGDKLLAWSVDLYLLDRRVLHIPWFFLTLRRQQSSITPDVGRNDEEGYFLRLLYQYAVSEEQLGGVRVDFTQKLGTGIGVDHFYTVPNGSGEAFLYGRQNLAESVVRVKHSQMLPADITVNLLADIRKNSQFWGQSSTFTDLNAKIERVTPHATTLFNYSSRLNRGAFSSDTASANFRYDVRGRAGTLSYSGELSSFGQSTGSAANQELWHRLQWRRQVGVGDLILRVDKHEDPDGAAFTGDENFYGLERFPELSYEASLDKLGPAWLAKVPSRLAVGWSLLEEHPGKGALNRYLINWQATPRPLTWGRTTVTANSTLKQTFYGDAEVTAHYTYQGYLTALTNWGALSHSLGYSKQDGHGFSPFRLDENYSADTLTDGLQYTTKTTKLYLNSGRDLQNQRWHDLTIRADFAPAPTWNFTHAWGYDPNDSRWRDAISQVTWQRPDRTTVKLGSRYDLEEGRLRRVSSDVSWVLSPLWRLQWLGGYDGSAHETLYNEWLVVRDLHCWDVSLAISHQQKSAFLNFRLKALDLPFPRFGIGKGGQLLDTTNDLGY
jgi:hypothetical protein